MYGKYCTLHVCRAYTYAYTITFIEHDTAALSKTCVTSSAGVYNTYIVHY